ncbi:MAG: DNA translocase FtsK, partial [Verrucomicrobia bacterium]|nr:DNA translocase FtsK [Verrucomicrobiota bacterium]
VMWVTLIACSIMVVEWETAQALFKRLVAWIAGLGDVADRVRENATSSREEDAVVARPVRAGQKPRRVMRPSPSAEADDAVEPDPVRPETPKRKSMLSIKPKMKKQIPVPTQDELSSEDELVPFAVAEKAPGQRPNYTLPSTEILEPIVESSEIHVDTEATAQLLIDTLADFGIEGQINDVEVGPVVTSYEVLPAPGVRVERISNLANNLALSLKATSIRVQAPIPGKGVVGIEVPNGTSQLVQIRDIIEGDVWRRSKAHLPLVLGKDVGGKDLVVDLAAMPHLLIAGATGAGKTVCMNSILAGLLMSRTPDEMRLMLVDPKIVEFSVFAELPHLVVPVITDAKKVSLGLRWAINEMESRYKLFAKAGVRNIVSYNTREIVKQEELFGEELPPARKDEPPATVPYIVLVIDELADLMLADQAGIENGIARLAQLSRAVGIHMIIATQRPSVNVITGTIKANFPGRIAFQVAQRVDSRTILDTVGADKLLGKGDMLYLSPGSSKLMRAQGALTTDTEIHSIADFWRAQGEPAYEMEIKEKLEKPESTSKLGDDPGDDDDLLEQAIEIIRETHRASTSSLQRRLRIGYTRAARIIDILEERGILGPPRGSEPREILIDLNVNTPGMDNEEEDSDFEEEEVPQESERRID